MCGPTSAIGLEQHERDMWAQVKDRLRQPGMLAGLMRGFLADGEAAAVIATAPTGQVRPLAILVTPSIAGEIELDAAAFEATANAGRRTGRVGDYDVEVLLGEVGGQTRPLALLVTPWIFEHLTLYARELWRRR